MVRPRRIRKPGIYDLTAAEYLADPCAQPSLSRSIAQKLVDQSPAHAWQHHPRYGDRPEADDDDGTMDVGSAAHAAFLLGEDLIAEFSFSSWRSDAARARRSAARLVGKIPLLSEKAATVRAVVEALYRFRQRTGAFTHGKAEQTVIWREGETYCRCKPDWLPDDPVAPLWDLKVTAGIASPATWKFRAAEVAADLQAVMYPRGVAAVRNRQPRGMKFCVVEEAPPHGIRVFYYSGEALELAQAKYDRALELWQQCQASGQWPNYDDEEMALDASHGAREAWAEFTATARGLTGLIEKREDITEKILKAGFA